MSRLAGERYRSHARSTGALIIVLDANESDLDDGEGGRWVTLCDTHSNLVSHQTLRTARSWMAEPEMWCSDCQGAQA